MYVIVFLRVKHELRVYTIHQGANYKKILRLSYDVIITYDNVKMLLITKTSHKIFL